MKPISRLVIAAIVCALPTLPQIGFAKDRSVPPGIERQDRIPGEGSHKGWEQGKHKGWDKGEGRKHKGKKHAKKKRSEPNKDELLEDIKTHPEDDASIVNKMD
jgi:hypothetical protein